MLPVLNNIKSNNTILSDEVHSGTLYQKAKFLQSWKARWYILYSNRKLCWWTNETESKTKKNTGQIDLTKVTKMVNDRSKDIPNKYAFEILCDGKTHIIASLELKSTELWYNKIYNIAYGTTIHEEWLMKLKGDYLLKKAKWKRRLFVLSDVGNLRVYKTDDKQILSESMDINQNTSIIAHKNKYDKDWIIELSTLNINTRWILATNSEISRNEWTSKLYQCIGDHPLQSVNEFTLIEEMKDIINNKYLNKKKKLDDVLKDLNVPNIQTNDIPALKNRIYIAIKEIQRQNHTQILEEPQIVDSKMYVEPKLDDIKAIEEEEEEKKVNNLDKLNVFTNDIIYNQIKNDIQIKMNNILNNKTKDDILNECTDNHCCNNNNINIWNECNSLQRIKMILNTYQELINKKKIYQIPIGSLISYRDIYGFQQLFNDFMHIKIIHIDKDSVVAKYICEKFEDFYSNHDVTTCNGYTTHYRDRHIAQKYFRRKTNNKKHQKQIDIMNTKDIVFQQECDKIHSYFLHSTIKYGNDLTNITQNNISIMDNNARYTQYKMIGRSITQPLDIPAANVISSDDEKKIDSPTNLATIVSGVDLDDGSGNDRVYPAKFDRDVSWWQDVNDIQYEAKNGSKKIYKDLVKKIGVFKWQSAYGFRTGQNQSIFQAKPRWKNIKEEALRNIYEPISINEWKQSLRKSKAFYQSWARKQLRTKYEGKFDDRVTGTMSKWKINIDITMAEIISLKLYTDFNSLQFEFKKCFRFESLRGVVNAAKMKRMISYSSTSSQKIQQKTSTLKISTIGTMDALTPNKSLTPTNDLKMHSLTPFKSDHTYTGTRIDTQLTLIEDELEERLKQFYHWRVKLLTTINKFAIRLSSQRKYFKLYHGVSYKMILNPTQTLSFYGPLSTTSSAHVAKTFAGTGMILEIASMYPRLNLCNAFNASLLSDYPDEQEWLVGFMYVRLLRVIITDSLLNNARSFSELLLNIPMASLAKSSFFAMHLFKEQTFAMNDHPQYIINSYLSCYNRECCNHNKIKNYNQSNDSNWNLLNDWKFFLCKHIIQHNSSKNIPFEALVSQSMIEWINNNENQFKKQIIISKILWNKFKECRHSIKSVRFDKISNLLKRFFMDKNGFDLNNKQKWIVSFKKINKIYPNIKQIHFLNQYKLDDIVLNKLIKHLNDNKTTKLKKIKFSYYNYRKQNNQNKPLDSTIFCDPDTLNKYNGITIKHYGERVGYQIKVLIQ